MSRHDSENDDRYVEIQLDGRQIIIVLAGVLLLCAVSFHFGRRVGRADTGQADTQMAALVDDSAGTEAVSEEDAAAGMTFFDNVGRRSQPSSPPAVDSGESAAAGSTPRPVAQKPRTQVARSEPVAAEKPVETAPSPSKVTGNFLVQVAAYQERARAEALAGRLRQKGYRALIADEPDGGRTLYKVRIGGYMDRSAADAAKTRLAREEKLQAWVLPAGA